MATFGDFLTTSDVAAMNIAAGIAPPKPTEPKIRIESAFNPDGTYTGGVRITVIQAAPQEQI